MQRVQRAAILGALLAGCGSGPTRAPTDGATDVTPTGETGAPSSGCTDADDCDGDGMSPEEGDCDDANSGIRPGMYDPAYDGVDWNCDGWSEYDADKDGQDAAEYGGEDCEDFLAQVGLGFPEICDGRDNDCDQAVDEDHPASIGGTPYDTVEAAVAAASPKAEVNVCPGEWVVATLDVSGLELSGAGEDVTVLRAAAPAGPVVTASSGEGRVEALRVTGATAGPGIRLTGGTLDLQYLMVDGCRTGIEVVGGPGTLLRGSATRVEHNANPDGAGGGLFASGPVVVEMRGIYEHNTAMDGAGGALRDGATLVCGDSHFSNNVALRDGGGLHARGASLAVPTDVVISPCSFGYNEAGQDGGGAWFGGATIDARALQGFTGNRAGRHGGGAAMVSTIVEDLTAYFGDNDALEGGGLYVAAGARATLSSATVRDHDLGGGIRVTGTGEVSTTTGISLESNLPYDLATDLGSHTLPYGPQVFACTGVGGCDFP